jgi:AcrR family transcriptional regulator
MNACLVDNLWAMKRVTPRARDEPVRFAGQLRKDAALNRDRLLAAAIEVFARDGLNATIDDIAHHAGVGVGTAYRNFTNKQALIDTLMIAQVDNVFHVVEQASAEVADPWLAFEMFVWHAVRIQAENRGLREMMAANEGIGHEIARERLKPVIRRLVRAAQASGQMRPEIVANDIPAMFWMTSAILDQTGDIKPTLWQRYVRLLLDGMRAQPTSSPPLAPKALSEDQLDASMQTGRRKT